ncbi:hypothetical protein FHY55_16110 [Oceanicola sp. D3]|uniref:hypothetical protein n=1 Tax=Oceanicola sp. D3 TaxID=2587163 RepID=UPI00111CB0AE|nr:hypothetical protein [Oceanicola sp. D3]QDC10662.1 hypothetical protein FHY55_16110 [Oceanicola sp. D3]
MKTLLKTALILVALGLAFCALSPASRAEAKSCGGNGQQACALETPATPQCGAWLHELGGTCRPCGSAGLAACERPSNAMSCRAGLANHFGRCVVPGEGSARPAKLDLGQIFGGNRADKIRWAATQYLNVIEDAATELRATLPGQRDASALVAALETRNGAAVKRILAANPEFRASLDTLKRMGFNTITIGLQSRVGESTLQETGYSIDLDFAWAPRLYTTAAIGAATDLAGEEELVFSVLKPGNTRIGGAVYGTVTTLPASNAPVAMWFSDAPFDFTGFSLGLGVDAMWAGGAVSYATTKLWH